MECRPCYCCCCCVGHDDGTDDSPPAGCSACREEEDKESVNDLEARHGPSPTNLGLRDEPRSMFINNHHQFVHGQTVLDVLLVKDVLLTVRTGECLFQKALSYTNHRSAGRCGPKQRLIHHQRSMVWPSIQVVIPMCDLDSHQSRRLGVVDNHVAQRRIDLYLGEYTGSSTRQARRECISRVQCPGHPTLSNSRCSLAVATS